MPPTQPMRYLCDVILWARNPSLISSGRIDLCSSTAGNTSFSVSFFVNFQYPEQRLNELIIFHDALIASASASLSFTTGDGQFGIHFVSRMHRLPASQLPQCVLWFATCREVSEKFDLRHANVHQPRQGSQFCLSATN